MVAQRKAEATWEHDLLHGSGRVKMAGGAFGEARISWSARTESLDGKTSPEELLAAAHASCFAMALSNTLAKAQTPPEQVHVTATCTFDKVGDGWAVTTMDLDVEGKVPGSDAAKFEAAAKAASEGCPISKALHGNVQIRVKAHLT
ncbi:MAG TPA: OsmC family peroxiredoxin [Thermoplasmata archaeon]|nr:OsmC family peroxiredoxin [Thermoplasmata archaeon]